MSRRFLCVLISWAILIGVIGDLGFRLYTASQCSTIFLKAMIKAQNEVKNLKGKKANVRNRRPIESTVVLPKLIIA
jgi:hypothetical protein